MTVKHQVSRTVETRYGSRKVLRTVVDDVEYDFTVNEYSPLYRYLIGGLAKVKKI